MPFSGSDEEITCKGCGQPFVFTVGEQAFYDRKGFVEKPKRCPPCREAAKARRSERDAGSAALPRGARVVHWDD